MMIILLARARLDLEYLCGGCSVLQTIPLYILLRLILIRRGPIVMGVSPNRQQPIRQ
jgi:hypothetical protein